MDNKLSEFETHIENWTDFTSWCRWFPDLFLDMIKPEKGGINLNLDQRIFLRSIMRFVSLYGVFPRGYGKCVTGDTLIFTEDGIKEIGELFDYQSDGNETYYDTKVKVLNKDGVLENTESGVYNGKQKTRTIVVNEGYSITGTLEHPILVMTNEGKFQFKKLKYISYDDYIVINKNNDVWGKNKDIDYNAELYLWMKRAAPSYFSRYANSYMPKRINTNIAEAIGVMSAKTYPNSNKLSIVSSNKQLISYYYTLFRKEFEIRKTAKTSDSCSFYDTQLVKYFEHLGCGYVKEKYKTVPKVIMSAPREIVIAFLKGLFEIKGCLTDSGLLFETRSEKYINQLHVILLNLGIITKKSVSYHTRHNSLFKILITGDNLAKFQSIVKLRFIENKNKIGEISKKTKRINQDEIPLDRNIIAEFCRDALEYNIGSYSKIQHYIYHNYIFTYEKLDWLLNLKQADKCKNYEILKEIQSKQYHFTQMKCSSSGENDVYDFYIPETHSFVSNGFISHNTFIEVLAGFLACVFFPNLHISISAQTKENAADLLQSKFNEINRFYPMLANEIKKTKFGKSVAEIEFKNSATFDILVNGQQSKGQRRHRLGVEESALLNNELYEDVLEPIVNVGRSTVGTAAIVNPAELNHQINFYTTSGFRGSDEYNRNVSMTKSMINLDGTIVLGSGWELACWYGRGLSKSAILQKKKDVSSVSFAQNYESKWVGVADSALVDINKLLACRTLQTPICKTENVNDEYYIGVDVARSESTANNQSSAAIVKVRRNSIGRVVALELVNTIGISNTKNFTGQAIQLKKLKRDYNARMVITDGNGLGIGLIDELLKEQYDPETGESLGCWNTINTENTPEDKINADPCLFDLKAQGIQSKIVSDFIDAVDSGKLKMLIKRKDSDFTIKEKEDMVNNVLPFIQTDFLFEEIANLKLKILANGNLTVEKSVRKMNKDRWSALAYVIYYIMEYENNVVNNDASELEMLNSYTYL